RFTPLREFLDEESAYQACAERGEALHYFSARFADRPAATWLSGGTGPPARGERRTVLELAPAEFAGLRSAAARLDTRWFGLVAMAFAVHVAGTCGTDEAILSVAVSGRATPAARTTPTRAANVLPLRLSVAPDLTWRQLGR